MFTSLATFDQHFGVDEGIDDQNTTVQGSVYVEAPSTPSTVSIPPAVTTPTTPPRWTIPRSKLRSPGPSPLRQSIQYDSEEDDQITFDGTRDANRVSLSPLRQLGVRKSAGRLSVSPTRRSLLLDLHRQSSLPLDSELKGDLPSELHLESSDLLPSLPLDVDLDSPLFADGEEPEPVVTVVDRAAANSLSCEVVQGGDSDGRLNQVPVESGEGGEGDTPSFEVAGGGDSDGGSEQPIRRQLFSVVVMVKRKQDPENSSIDRRPEQLSTSPPQNPRKRGRATSPLKPSKQQRSSRRLGGSKTPA